MRLPTSRPILAFVLALAATAAGPARAKDFAFETKEGCGITRYAKAWVKQNVASMSWSGECNKNGRARGKGVLEVVLKDGGSERYEGDMKGGRFEGQGDYRARNGWRRVGEFIDGWFVRGQIYGDDGKLRYDGGLYLYTDGYHIGKVYYPDGGWVEATFIQGAQNYNRATGEGISDGVVYDAKGVVLGWWVRGQFLRDENSAYAARQQMYAADSARMQAETEAFYQKQKQENDAAWAQLGGMLGAGLTAQGGQQQRLTAMTNALNAPPPTSGGFGTGLVQGMVSGATGNMVGPGYAGTAPNSRSVREVPRGPVSFDPASTSPDESRCVRAIIEETGQVTSHSTGGSTPDVWILLANDCGYDVQAVYCFEVNQHGYSCATAYPQGWRGDATLKGTGEDSMRRTNMRFNGDLNFLLNPAQRVFLGACRYRPADPAKTGRFVSAQHRFSGGGFQFRCMEP